MRGEDGAQEGEEGFRFVDFDIDVGSDRDARSGGGGGGGGGGDRVVFLDVHGRAGDGVPVEREGERGGVEGDEGVADGLVHVAVEVGAVGGLVGRIDIFGEGSAEGRWWWWWRRGRGEVRQGDDAVVVGEAVEEGEEAVFAAGDEADDVEGRGRRRHERLIGSEVARVAGSNRSGSVESGRYVRR